MLYKYIIQDLEGNCMAVVPKENSLETLKKLIPLNLLSEADLEQLGKTAVYKKDRTGGYLFRQGDTDYHNIYLLTGKVALLENMKEVDRVAAGSETARFPLGHQIPRKNSARAIGNVEYVLIDNRKLSEMLVRNKDDDYKVADLNSNISDDWMDQLLQSKVFQQIPPSNIQGVIMRMEEVEVKRGQKVIEQGGDGDYFFLIHQGRCTVSRKEEGKRKATELAKLGPGDSFGEEALLSDSPRNSSVTMLTKGVLLRLAKEDFIEFVKRPLARGVSFAQADLLVNKGAIWLDVRPPSAYESGHLEHSVSFPLETLRYQAPNLAPDQEYVICCDDGHVSSTAAYLLTDRGFSVSVLEGGLRTVPSEMLIKEKAGSAESGAQVISLHPGEEADQEQEVSDGTRERDNFKQKLVAANSRIKELGVKFKRFRESKQKEESKLQAEIKAQKVIIDKNRIRLDELKARRESDRRLIEQLQQESGELNTSLRETTEKLSLARGGMADLEAKLNAEYDSEQKSTTEIDELKKEVNRYQERLESVMAEKAALEESLDEQRKGHGDASKKQGEALNKAEEQIQQLRTELTQSQGKYSASQSELEEVKSALLDRPSEKEVERLRTELDKSQELYKNSQAELEEVKSALLDRSSEKEVERLRTELDKSQELYKDSQAELEEIKRALLDREEKLESALAESDLHDSVEIETLREEITTLTEALGEADLAYDQIREQAEALSKEKEQLTQKMQELEQESAISKPQKLIDDSRTSIESEVFGDVYEDVVSKGLEMAEEESLRQELEDLRKTTQNWEQRVTEAEEKCRKLDDALEDRDKEIDQFKIKLDEEKARVAEVEEQHQQSEETVSKLRELSAQGLTANEYVDPRLTSSDKALHIEHLVSDQPTNRVYLWVILGVGICFAVLEAIMIFSGRGELLTGLFKGDEQQKMPRVVEESTAPKLAKSLTQAFGIDENQNVATDAPTDISKSGDKPEPAWSVLNDISFGPVMVKLRGGSFIMGSNRSQVSSDQWPAHEVDLKAFAISQTEVTFDNYDRFAQATGRRLPKDQGWGRGNRPVVDVSWDDAVAYTKWLSERTGKKYRLPTEAEWEFAIRSGGDSTYWWGYQMEEGRANCFDCGSNWDRKSTAPVASFPPNNFGLYDIEGNVREWVMDCYHPNYSGAPLDGSAWLERGCRERVVRGGAYNKTSDSMRSIWRGHIKPNLRFTFIGFRVVREL
jgi:formylglycine-generating enzyme required for sulfatase activity/CRP-like cAMP-binding protein